MPKIEDGKSWLRRPKLYRGVVEPYKKKKKKKKKELYMFRTDLLSIIRSLNTVFTAIGICHTSYVDCLLAT